MTGMTGMTGKTGKTGSRRRSRREVLRDDGSLRRRASFGVSSESSVNLEDIK